MDPLWADLINSDWHDHRGSGERADRLEDDGWLARFLARAEWRGSGLPGVSERRALRALRGVLRRSTEALLAGGALPGRELAAINRALASSPSVRRLERHGQGELGLVAAPTASGMPAVLAAVAASFAEMLAGGGAGRIRVCANPDCRWVFYDSSRNRSRRWCEAAVCGSLIKVRRFRARQRLGDGPGTAG